MALKLAEVRRKQPDLLAQWLKKAEKLIRTIIGRRGDRSQMI